MAKEFGDRRIRANAISPGPIRTDLADRALEKYPEFAELLTAQTALGRLGEPGDVGRMIASLLSDDHAWVNAQTIEVGGGYMIWESFGTFNRTHFRSKTLCCFNASLISRASRAAARAAWARLMLRALVSYSRVSITLFLPALTGGT